MRDLREGEGVGGSDLRDREREGGGVRGTYVGTGGGIYRERGREREREIYR